MKKEEYVRPTKKSDKFEMKPHLIREEVLIGDWEETNKIPTETLRKWTNEPEKLDGLIIKGYEMKFGKTNGNGEQYEKTAFDEFIKSYFVEKGFNMPVDINHEGYSNWHAYCGKVLYIEVNSVGFYFVVHIPRNYPEYDRLVWALQSGIIQGFSKEGWAEEYEYKWKEDGTFDYELIKKIAVTSVSLVCSPANGLPFEKMQETKNALVFKNNIEEDKKPCNTLQAMFNHK